MKASPILYIFKTCLINEKGAVHPICVAMFLGLQGSEAFLFFKLKTMEKKEIQIPNGCKRIQIDIENGLMTVLYESAINEKYIDCEETGDSEERPSMGDFSIFWDRNNRNNAICAHFDGMSREGWFKSSYGRCFDEAIKFRNNEQYLSVRGIYED